MSWFDILLIGAVLVGVTAGTALVVRSPTFWGGLIVGIVDALMPLLAKRLPADKEEEWRKATRHADGGDEWRRKRLGLPPKG